MKIFRRVLIVMLILSVCLCFVACNPSNSGGGQGNGNTPTPSGNELKASDIAKLPDLTKYGDKQATYAKSATDYNKDAKTYAGKDCTNQITALQVRIDQKHQDVVDEKSTSSFIKIFAMSTAEDILAQMAEAALTYEEMSNVVNYLSGSVAADVNTYIKKETNGSWSGFFSGNTLWRSKKNADGKAFNTGWSFFDDWETYDRLKDFAEDSQCPDKDLAGDNAAWQYRSILGKVYTEVALSGDAAARLATYMLDYAVEIVEKKSNGLAEDAIKVTAGVTSYGEFTKYCKKIPTANDPFSGLADYETLSYLLAFNEYYNNGNGLQDCVTLYGYYYDYNQRYYKESLADEAIYAKQLKYEKMKRFSDEEWLDYVSIQRTNYTKAYRYSEACYSSFYEYHFDFQGVVEQKDVDVYQMTKVSNELGLTRAGTTYTTEMKTAVSTSTDGLNGLKGQLALSDWMWCYAGSEENMKAYNGANTKYEEGKDGSSEEENEGKFYYEKEELKMVYYMFDKMEDTELASALYYQVYAYSASMVNTLQNDIKDIVYIRDNIESGSTYTQIISTLNNEADKNSYAIGKISVLYEQARYDWYKTKPSELANKAKTQNWTQMGTELKAALDYDYMGMAINNKNTQWKERVDRLEDMVIARKWSCCGQRVNEADVTKCPTQHAENPDGTVATKEYATDHTISQFVSAYENVLYHIAGRATLKFQAAAKKSEGSFSGFVTGINENKTWTSGYNGTIKDLMSSATTKLEWFETETITLATGDAFIDTVDGKDKDWWVARKQLTDEKNAYGPFTHTETYNANDLSFRYTYTFTGWYLDKNCQYEFSDMDDVSVNLYIYAGYTVTKARQ